MHNVFFVAAALAEAESGMAMARPSGTFDPALRRHAVACAH